MRGTSKGQAMAGGEPPSRLLCVIANESVPAVIINVQEKILAPARRTAGLDHEENFPLISATLGAASPPTLYVSPG